MRCPVRFALPALLSLVLLPLGGCAEDVDATADAGRPFTLWGRLDPAEGLQAIRVIPIARTIDEPVPDAIDAAVTSTDLATGAVTVWRDSLVTFTSATGQVLGRGYVFVSDARPAYGSLHEIRVARADGAASTVRVAVPRRVEPAIGAASGLPGDVRLPVVWTGAPRVNAVVVDALAWRGACAVQPVRLAVAERDLAAFEFGWRARLPLTEIGARLSAALGGGPVGIVRMTVSALVTNAEWRPPFPFDYDPQVTAEPGTLTNVGNGFGFVGAAYRSALTFTPDDAALQAAGMLPSAGCDG
ncbi:MAG: hypothetical protein ACK41D_06640 [Rubricoccaceae bacterium]